MTIMAYETSDRPVISKATGSPGGTECGVVEPHLVRHRWMLLTWDEHFSLNGEASGRQLRWTRGCAGMNCFYSS